MGWSFVAILAVAANIVFSIVLVLLNKRLVVDFQFKFMTVLSGLHFAVSFLLCVVFIICGLLKYKSVNSYWSVFRISLGSLLSVIFMNYCLSHSSVGFYQVVKLFCIPLTLFFEHLFGLQQEVISTTLLLSLLLIIAGMAMIIREEVSTNVTGILWGLCGIVTTALSQVFFGPLKKGLNLDAFQLLFHTSPWLTFGSFVSVPVFENTDALIAYDLHPVLVCNVLLTCVIAVAFNVSNYVVLGEISPLTYNIIGHVKTIIIVSVGSLLFNTVPSAMMLGGMTVAVVGVLVFTLEKENQQELKKNSLPHVALSMDANSPFKPHLAAAGSAGRGSKSGVNLSEGAAPVPRAATAPHGSASRPTGAPVNGVQAALEHGVVGHSNRAAPTEEKKPIKYLEGFMKV